MWWLQIIEKLFFFKLCQFFNKVGAYVLFVRKEWTQHGHKPDYIYRGYTLVFIWYSTWNLKNSCILADSWSLWCCVPSTKCRPSFNCRPHMRFLFRGSIWNVSMLLNHSLSQATCSNYRMINYFDIRWPSCIYNLYEDTEKVLASSDFTVQQGTFSKKCFNLHLNFYKISLHNTCTSIWWLLYMFFFSITEDSNIKWLYHICSS